MDSDTIIKPILKPVTLKVDNIISKTIYEIKYCDICGKPMKKSTIYPYNSTAVKIFICKNKDCSQYEKANFH